MTDLRKAAEMALEAFEILDRRGGLGLDVHEYIRTKIEALRQALAQPEQEPVAYLDEGLGAFYWANDYKKDVGFTPLYAVPPHRWSNVTDEALMQEVRRRGFVIRDAQIGREWVGLTNEDMEALFLSEDGVCFARYIETKLKEKNNG